MRFLKVTAQDRSGNGKADVVHLHFHDGLDLVHEAVAIDLSADGLMDFVFSCNASEADKHDFKDRSLLKSFSESFLKLNWFNTGDRWEREVHIQARDYHKDGSPNSVTVQFNEDDGSPATPVLIRRAAAYDGDNDGSFDSFTNSDVDNDGKANKADKELLRSIANTFVPLRWYET